MLSARAIATSGIGFNPLLVAVSGLLPAAVNESIAGSGGDDVDYEKSVKARGKWLRGERVPSIFDHFPDAGEMVHDHFVDADKMVERTPTTPSRLAAGAAQGVGPVIRTSLKKPTLNQPIIGAEEMEEEVLLLMLMLADD